jgi:hypothetical protein
LRLAQLDELPELRQIERVAGGGLCLYGGERTQAVLKAVEGACRVVVRTQPGELRLDVAPPGLTVAMDALGEVAVDSGLATNLPRGYVDVLD